MCDNYGSFIKYDFITDKMVEPSVNGVIDRIKSFSYNGYDGNSHYC